VRGVVPGGTGWTLGVVAGLALALNAAPVRACSGSVCSPGRFLPRDGATIPQNTPALAWQVTRAAEPEGVDVAEPQLLHVTGDSTAVVDYVVEAGPPGWSWIVPAALVEGERYRLQMDGECASEAVEFDVGPVAELPEALGVTRVGAVRRERVAVAEFTHACFEFLPGVRADVSLGLAPAAEPWAGLWLYETWVDDELWSPAWTSGDEEPYDLPDDEHIVYAECPAAGDEGVDDTYWHVGLAEGRHVVKMRATLPGHDGYLLASAETTRLECGDGGGCGVSSGRGRPAPPALLLLLAAAWVASRCLRIRR